MQQAAVIRATIFLLIGMVTTFGWSLAFAGDPGEVVRLTTALDELDQWVGTEANGDRWRKFLGSRVLRAQIAEGREADPARVSRILEQYYSGKHGLDKQKFVTVRRELESWLTALKGQYAADLPKFAWAARGDYRPARQAAHFASVHEKLRKHARALEQKLGKDSQFAQDWKRYLRWERLAPSLSEDVETGSQSLADLTAVLKRFRSNAGGLENLVFTRTADALARYRGLVQWYDLVGKYAARSRKKYRPESLERRVYQLRLLELEKQLTRHLETPTMETTRKVGQLLGLVEHLNQSPQLVQAIRSRFTQPNVMTEISESAINQLAGRPIQETRPVRDVILGARIHGMATSTGRVEFRTLPAEEHIEIEVQLAGNIQSDTRGDRKPVRIFSHGSTDFVAAKRLEISDEHFMVLPANVSAHTKTKIRAIRKTGRQFGHRFVERIAWKKVRESKSLGERIASGRAAKKIAKKFDDQLIETIFQARENYDRKARPPLVRLGMFPEYLRMASNESSVNVEARLASYEQVSTDTEPIARGGGYDLSLKLHETAVNNFLPSLLAGVGLEQEKESEPPTLTGDFPPWLKKLAEKNREDREAGAHAEAKKEPEVSEFKPFALTLNSVHPVSVRFDDQQVTLRIRIAELKTIEEGEEQIREHWDFLVSFQVLQEGNGILLRRNGPVEALPTGFDPNPHWGDRLTSEQVATRGVLAKVLNKRADGAKGLPEEIALPPIQIPGPNGVELPLVLQHLDCDDGWLTLGYQLPKE